MGYAKLYDEEHFRLIDHVEQDHPDDHWPKAV